MTPQPNKFIFMRIILQIIRPLVLTALTPTSFAALTLAQEVSIGRLPLRLSVTMQS